MTEQVPRLLDVKTVAPMLGIHANQVYIMANQGQLPAVRVGRYWRFPEDQLLEWIRRGGTNHHVDPKK